MEEVLQKQKYDRDDVDPLNPKSISVPAISVVEQGSSDTHENVSINCIKDDSKDSYQNDTQCTVSNDASDTVFNDSDSKTFVKPIVLPLSIKFDHMQLHRDSIPINTVGNTVTTNTVTTNTMTANTLTTDSDSDLDLVSAGHKSFTASCVKTFDHMFTHPVSVAVPQPQPQEYPIIEDNLCTSSAPVSESAYFRSKHCNANWCDFCFHTTFIHKNSSKQFVDRCIKCYEKNKNKFFGDKNKDAHMLGSLLCLEESARIYLHATNRELYDRFGERIRIAAKESKEYVTGGIIHQYNERVYLIESEKERSIVEPDETLETSGFRELKKDPLIQHFDPLLSIDLDEWLVKNNIRCAKCSYLACPFHRDFAGFETITIPRYADTGFLRQKQYCCGWCADLIKSADNLSITSSCTSFNPEDFEDDDYDLYTYMGYEYAGEEDRVMFPRQFDDSNFLDNGYIEIKTHDSDESIKLTQSSNPESQIIEQSLPLNDVPLTDEMSHHRTYNQLRATAKSVNPFEPSVPLCNISWI